MEFFAGLDIGMDETAICVVDDKDQVMMEVAVATDPETLKAALVPYLARLRRVGHEAGSLSPWLHGELLKLGLPAICLETQHVRAALKAQRNKTDKVDALGIAHIMRTGWFRKAHIKSQPCPVAAVIDAPAQSETQVSRPRERGPALAEGVRHPAQPRLAVWVCASRARRGGGRRAGQRADRRHVECTRGALEGILPAAQVGGEVGRRPRSVPAVHAASGRRADRGVELFDRGRRSIPLQALA